MIVTRTFGRLSYAVESTVQLLESVRHIPVLRFPPLRFGPTFSSPVFLVDWRCSTSVSCLTKNSNRLLSIGPLINFVYMAALMNSRNYAVSKFL